GRADAIIITTQNHAVMIDTGENRHGRAITYFMHGENITSLDYLIITHFDSDHVGGAHEIIRSIDVNKIIVPNYSRESRHMERFAAAKLDAGLEAYVLKEEIRFTLDGAEFIVNPSALEYFHFSREEDDTEEEINAFIPTGDDFSIVVSVTHGENSFLFTGDAVANRLGEILAHEEIMSTDYIFLKVPRHGRHNRRSVEFIQAISPRYAVITGFHPNDLNRYAPERPTDERVIAALESVGAEIFFTMSEGIRIICNGHEIIVAEK
ncbi:MAG: MBL fold metallo-hydrolase, partial [Defluviitaleaceae bacterium]|nr:MBL fold metallo-hydrolase [Defluviitaleaceae bacterium]